MANQNKYDAIILTSGGLDSTTLAYWLESQGIYAIPIFFDYGQHCVNTEYETLVKVLPKSYLDKLEVIDISEIYKGSQSRLIVEPNLWEDEVTHHDLYLPYRNLLFLSVGAAIAQTKGVSVVYSAFINSNHAIEIDASAEFFDNLNLLLRSYGSVKIEMPFRDKTKYEVAKIGIELKAPVGFTFSCQASSDIPCGACPNCVDRLEALKKISEENL